MGGFGREATSTLREPNPQRITFFRAWLRS
jgi:hypothetical protein